MGAREFLPQYAAQAVIDLERSAKRLQDQATMGFYTTALRSVASLIRHAVHVILPENGEVYRSNDYGGDMPSPDECESFMGLPAPVTCFEYPWSYARRAHIRKLPTGVLTFVRQCFVGDKERGEVKKHYAMAQ